MIPFRDLQNLADQCRDKTGISTRLLVEHWAWGNEVSGKKRSRLNYHLAINDIIHEEFRTIKELKAAIRNILNPPKDVGVTLTDVKEEVEDESV